MNLEKATSRAKDNANRTGNSYVVFRYKDGAHGVTSLAIWNLPHTTGELRERWQENCTKISVIEPEPKKNMHNYKFDCETQIDTEEAIASLFLETLSEEKIFVPDEVCSNLGREILKMVVERLHPNLVESEPKPTEEDPIDRMIRERSLNSELKIKITFSDFSLFRSVEIWFIGFIPSDEVLKPFRKMLMIEGFQELRGPFTRPNNFTLTLPNEGWSAKKVALVLKEIWEKEFEVEVEGKSLLS